MITYKSGNVLDFSAGWGDRLAGFYCGETTKSYVGIDPNTNNHPNYKRQVEFYKKHQTFLKTKEVEFICEPAKMWIIQNMKIISIQYLHHHLISMLRNIPMKIHKVTSDIKTLIVGIKNFLHKTLEKIIPTLKKGWDTENKYCRCL